jgi:hypothetical protein
LWSDLEVVCKAYNVGFQSVFGSSQNQDLAFGGIEDHLEDLNIKGVQRDLGGQSCIFVNDHLVSVSENSKDAITINKYTYSWLSFILSKHGLKIELQIIVPGSVDKHSLFLGVHQKISSEVLDIKLL